MQKKTLISIIIGIIIILSCIGIYLYLNRAYSIITIDINPSIEIRLDKNNNVKKVLKDKECINEEKTSKRKERYCDDNATLIDGERCLILSDSTDFIDGYVCNEINARIINNECIVYDIINAERAEKYEKNNLF